MGLETVELVMDLEDEFDVEITEDDASGVSTVGDLRDLLVRKVREKSAGLQRKGWCRTQQAFYFVRRAVDDGLSLTRRRSRIRPGDRGCRSLTPRHWLGVRRRLMDDTNLADLPEARRGFLGRPVGHVDETLTFGDLARSIAASPEPVWGCSPPLGPEPEAIVRDPELVGQRLRTIIHNEFGIPLERIRFDSRLYEDLDLG